MTGEALRVQLRGRDVGLLERFPTTGEYVFSFEHAYLEDPEREVLGQFFEDMRPNSFSTKGLPAWFANLLPQDRLKTLLSKGLGLRADDDFRLLGATGRDLPGAVEVFPTARRLEGLQPVKRQPDPAENPLALRFALSGVQLKLSILRSERGLTIPVQGKGGQWIAKFDDPHLPGLPRVEHATMLWARAAGIQIPEFELSDVREFGEEITDLETGDGSVFLIQRFDRSVEQPSDRIHIEDFAQVLDRMPGDDQYNGSYEEIAAIIERLAPSSQREFIRRLVFCVIAGNGDAHLKNWSLIYPNGREPLLSPAYDLVPTIVFSKNDNLALALNGSRKFRNVRLDSFKGLAANTSHEWETVRRWVREDVEHIFGEWQLLRKELSLTEREYFLLNRHVGSSRLIGT